jgi:hypothetical protein
LPLTFDFYAPVSPRGESITPGAKYRFKSAQYARFSARAGDGDDGRNILSIKSSPPGSKTFGPQMARCVLMLIRGGHRVG